MTDKKTEALKLALEALENSRSLEPVDVQWVKGKRHTAITAIREALEDHTEQHLEMVAKKQEPVAVYVGETWCGSVVRLYEDLPLETHLYTSPPASKPWLGLTDDDIESAMPGGIYDCLGDPWDCGVGDGDYMRSIKKDVLRVARAAIAAYEEKNGITGEKA